MNALYFLQQAKNVWDLLHTVGGGAIKNEAAEKYIFVKGAAEKIKETGYFNEMKQ